MRISIYIVAVLLIIAGCNQKKRENRGAKGIEHYTRDTIYSDDIVLEMKENAENHPIVKLKFLDKNNKKLLKFSKDTILLRILYHSKKFPSLNEGYEIRIDPVSENMRVLEQVGRNKVKLFIEPDSNFFVFDVFLSSRKNIFKSSYVDSNQKINYKIVPEISLFRKTYLP
jgi:hypothetical protein